MRDAASIIRNMILPRYFGVAGFLSFGWLSLIHLPSKPATCNLPAPDLYGQFY